MTIKYRREMVEAKVIDYIECNVCHKKIYKDDNEEYATLKEKWGYDSNKKDCQIHTIHFCDDCYEIMLDKMGIDRQEISREYLIGEE